jgi:FixJ family two-component response regulator
MQDLKLAHEILGSELEACGPTALETNVVTFAELADYCEQENYREAQYNDAGEKLFGVRNAGGNKNRDIANKLFISEETVKVHIKHIMENLGAADRTQAVAIGIWRGIIQL